MDSGGIRKAAVRAKHDFTPISWDKYFEQKSDIKIADDIFCVYKSGSTGPVCFFLHGGGFSALSWAVLSKVLTGSVNCQCIAMDLRGHGDTRTTDDENLEADVMASDVGKVVNKMYGEDLPPIILVGHSMGGAIATHIASRNVIPSLKGLIVIDVVEGSAMEALSSMQSFLKGRPATFKSLESAIEYCVKSGQIKNLESAKVSVVGQMKKIDTNETATFFISHQHEQEASQSVDSTIYEEGGRKEKGSKSNTKHSAEVTHLTDTGMSVPSERKLPSSNTGNQFTWRINLSKTEKFWKGWFQGLSKMFLTCSAAKMLLLAGVDRLDKELTVGQMQGKFQMQILPQCGHAVHEDNPDKVAEVIASFLVRNRFIEPSGNFQRSPFAGFPV